jgi:hypothetical protein
MSKGWESKSVEDQQAQAASEQQGFKSEVDHDARRRAAEVTRRKQALEMQRENILSQRTSSPHRRSALEAALVEIELELQTIGNAVHL